MTTAGPNRMSPGDTPPGDMPRSFPERATAQECQGRQQNMPVGRVAVGESGVPGRLGPARLVGRDPDVLGGGQGRRC